jgi:transformation/transcription domain-associated protein
MMMTLSLIYLLFCFVAIQFSDNAENKCRQIILEIFNRFPNSDVLKPCVFDMLKLSLRVLIVDNEDNSLTALRIIFDLHKSFRPSLEAQVQVSEFTALSSDC